MDSTQLAELDPITDGLRVTLSNASEASDLAVPAGAYDKAERKGWKVNKARTAWTYLDSRKGVVGPPTNGITKAVLKTKADGQTTLKLVGKNGAYGIAPPVTMQVTLQQGGCFAATPLCGFNASQSVLVCR